MFEARTRQGVDRRKAARSQKGDAMTRYVCDVCTYVYDPEIGDPENDIEPGTSFEDLPDDWVCPDCGVGTDEFSPEE